MAVDKDFVIRNGIQVNENLIYADANSDKIGIGTTTPDKKLVIIGDTEVSKQLAVGTTISAQRLVTTGVTTSNIGLDVGVGGTVFTSSTLTKKIGINSATPAYTLDVIGPVSIGQTAEYVYGDLTVTGNIKATSLAGQISAGGAVGFTNVTVEKNLDANSAEIFGKFTLEEVNTDTFRFLTAGDPPGIGFTQNADDPELYLLRGNKYEFHVDSGGFPFYIKTAPTADLDNIYNNGVDGNGTQVGILTIRVPFDAPNRLFYQASNVSGMGGTIYVNNDSKFIDVGFATVRERLDSDGYADFENIYVSGIGTINNIKSNNYSVSAGIVTVRQDQTAFIGVSTGADRVSVQTTNSSDTHQVTFVNNVGLGSNYPLHLIDSNTNQLTYVPSTNVLSCTRFVGNVSGIATGADNINVDEINTNTDFQVIFSEQGATDYKRMYIDTDNSHLTYNPSTETLTVENIIGNLFGIATNANFINVDENNTNTNFQILFSSNQAAGYQRPYIDSNSNQFAYNPSTRTFSVQNINTTTITGSSFSGISNRADFINVDEKADNVDYQVLFSGNQGADYQRPYIDSGSGQFIYNPSTNTLSVPKVISTFTGEITGNLSGTATNANFINVDEKADNVDYQVLFSSNQGAGYQRPYIDSVSGQFKYNPTTNRLTVGNFTGNGAGLTNLAGNKITTGVIDANRLPDASTIAQGVSKLNNSISGTSQTEAASSKAVGDLKAHANNASNLSSGIVPIDRLPNASTTAQGVSKLNNSISGTSQTEAASSKAVGDLKAHANNASNLTSGRVPIGRLPDASTTAQGVSKLNNSISGISETEAASSKAVGDLKAHANNASNLSSGRVPIGRLPDASTSAQGVSKLNNSISGTSQTQAASSKAVGDLKVHANNASNLTSGIVNPARLPDASTAAQGVVQLNNSISGTSQTEAASSKAVGDLKVHANNASNLTSGIVPIGRLPDASTTAQGVVRLSNAIANASETRAASSKAVSDLKSFASNASTLTSGIVNPARLPAATSTVQGAVKCIDTWPPTSTSTSQPPSALAFRRLYLTAGNIIPVGSNMLFYQAAAPVGWTKLTTHNNKTLRVVSGNGGGAGGNRSFTSAFAQRTVPVPTHRHNANAGDQSANHTHGGEAVSTNANHIHGGTAGFQNVPHNHGINTGAANGTFVTGVNSNRGDFDSDGRKEAVTDVGANFGSVGYGPQSVNQGNAAHSHSVTTNAANAFHGHNLSINAQTADHQHAITVANTGTVNNMDFRVQYIDVIICRRN